MTVSARVGLKILLFLLAVFVLVAGGFFVIVQSEQFKIWLQAESSRRSGYEVRFAQLSLGFPFILVADAVEVTKPGAFQLKTNRIVATFSPFGIWSKTIHRLAFEKPTLSLDIDEIMKTSSQSSADVSLRYLNIGDGILTVKKDKEIIFELAQIGLNAENLNLGQASGITLRADLPALKGEAEVSVKGQLREWQAEITVQPKQPNGLFSQLGAKSKVREFLHASIKFRAPLQQTASAVIESTLSNFTIHNLKLTGSLNAQADLDAKFSEISFSGHALLADFFKNMIPAPLQISNGDISANFTGRFSPPSKTLTVKTLRMSSPSVNGEGEGQVIFGTKPRITAAKLALRDLPLDTFKAYLPERLSHGSFAGKAQIMADAQGVWDALVVKGNLSGEKVQFHSTELNITELAFFARFDWAKSELRWPELKFSATKLAFKNQTGWQSSGDQLKLDASAESLANAALKLTGNLQTVGVKFSSPDSAKVGENFSLAGPIQLLSNSTGDVISIMGKLSGSSGELLWDQFFGDLKRASPAIEINADYSRGQDRLECRQCNLTLAGVGRIETVGSIEKLTDAPVLQLRAQSANFSPNAFFEFFLRDNLSRQYPVLEKLAVDGQLKFQLALRGTLDALTTEGELSLKGGELRAKSGNWQIGPFALDLPFQIHLAETVPIKQENPRTGTLSIDSIRFANQAVAPITTSISLATNALRFLQPIRLRVFGGEIEIANLFWPDVIRLPKQFAFSADTKRLQLPDLTDALSWSRFNGSLSGSIPQVQVSSDVLKTNGEIQADLFGGRVVIGKLEIDNPFSGLASIKLDTKLTGIQLEQLSQTFAFGRISGILEGSIDNLVMTAGQIAEMRADLHSVDRGGEQRISVEALNKITVLSSGEDAGALYGGLAGLFDSFRYSKLGFKANLKNDRLTLRGVESDGDKELLVVGSFLPPTVNIISHTQNIAFSELLRRLERIKNDKPNVK